MSMYLRVLLALACVVHAMMCAFHISRAVRAFYGVCCVLPCGYVLCVVSSTSTSSTFYPYVHAYLCLSSLYLRLLLWNRFYVFNEIYDVLSLNQRDGYGALLVTLGRSIFCRQFFAIVTLNAGRTASDLTSLPRACILL